MNLKIIVGSLAALFIHTASQAAEVGDDVVMEVDPSLPTHVIYRPAHLESLPRKAPVVAFGNGGCINRGDAFATFLRAIAKQGYVVAAPGPILGDTSAGQALVQSAPNQMIAVLDWAEAQANRVGSRWAGHLDLHRFAVMGQSCGGLEAIAAGADQRVKTVVVLNSGILRGELRGPAETVRPPLRLPATQADLGELHTPILYLVGGPRDIAYKGAEGDYAAITRLPIFNANLDVGHGGTWRQAGGGKMGAVAIAWLDWRLKHDRVARKLFSGVDCGLCSDPEWTVKKKRLR